MLVMVLVPGETAALARASVCGGIFGVVMACFLSKAIEVLCATAAHAAVLVVFVGSSVEK
jgi:hypothetical protein